VADGGSTAALITGMPGPTPAFLTTTFAPNQATQTAMTVPAAQAARPAMTRTMSAIMPQATPRIRTVRIMARVLIVEDDPYVRSAMVAELTRRSHAVRTAGTALDGIREVSHHPPEVVVLDLGLPDLDGGQALKMMRAITATTRPSTCMSRGYGASGETALGISDDAAWPKIAVTPMIGVNDTSDEIFTVANAQQLAAFAASKHLAWLSMWSAARDTECPGGAQSYASPTCSSIVQTPDEFMDTLGAY
jgi:CheY-like chemotaxis protein